jgi:hypothetical protein
MKTLSETPYPSGKIGLRSTRSFNRLTVKL